MIKTNIKIFLLFSLSLSVFALGTVAQNKLKVDLVTIESVIKDEKGKPVKGALVYGNEGSVISKTDLSGRFKIRINYNSELLIESEGRESLRLKPEEYNDPQKLVLKSSPYLLGEKDDINIAFGMVKHRRLVNAVNAINPQDILRYDNIQTVQEALSGRIPGLLGSSNIRGIGTPLFIVDGLPRDISTLNLSEVEQITVLKDINSSILYGNAAVNGVVLVKTRRGKAAKKELNVTGYYGVSTPVELPNFLPSAEYMELFNEARVNDGLAPRYDATTIQNYRTGNPQRYPNTDYYSSDYIKSIKPFSRVITELSGGNDRATYYSNLGWEQTGSLMDFGAGKAGKGNRINARGNIDMKISDMISSSLDAVAIFISNKGAVGNYWSEAATLQPNLFAPLIPIDRINPSNELLKGRKNDLDGKYLMGGTSTYLTNPLANGYSGGENENIQRTFSFNNRINFDLGNLVQGLAFHTNVSFDFYTRYDQSINNTYSVYEPTWNAAGDSIVSLNKFGSDVRTGNQNVANSFFQRRIGFYGLLDYDRTFSENHSFTGSLLAFGNSFKAQGDFQGNKNANLGLRLGYGFKDKYLVDFSAAYVNSVKLPEGNRLALSPSLGIAWVATEENFLSAGSTVNYLKIRASAGLSNSDVGVDGFYFYDNVYAAAGAYSWYDGTWSNNGTVSRYGGNNKLGFEKRSELNVGFEGLFFKEMLSVDANFFTSVYSDQITRPQTKYPVFYTDFIPYENFDENSYKGAELGLTFNKDIGKVALSLGVNAMYTTSEVIKRDEVYADQYRYRAGNPVDAMFGLVADGLFMDAAEIDNHSFQAFGSVKPGNIKYVDQNEDGIIDGNDEVYLGRSQAPFSYGLNLKLAYQGFTLFALGTGRRGADSYISGNYYWVDGNDKYSDYVLDRWTEATKTTATFPRLSSLANTNDFRNSTFWMYRNNFFTLNRVQLTYELPATISNSIRMKSLSFFLNASNIVTISKFKDITNLSIGSEPFYRSFSMGTRIMF